MDEPVINADEDMQKEIQPKKKLDKNIIIYIILIIIIVGLIACIIIISLTKEKEIEEIIINPDKKQETMNWDYYGEIEYNISYHKDNTIENTFREGGDNYKLEIGNINNGENYISNERNVYNLYIPHTALLNKDNYNGIILFIHGGSWIRGEKEDLEIFCKTYGEMGYITATMGYTVLHGIYPNNNIFRIMDEITFCLDDIKSKLKEKEFNVEKLELAIGGYSAGGHITLLYTYLIKKVPIKLKFAIDICGPISLEPKHYCKLAKVNDTLKSLEMSDVKPALENGRIIRTGTDDTILLQYMNAFLGERYKKEDLEKMLYENKTINYSNEKFQELYKSVKYSYPISIKDENLLPTLCLYTGNDDVVGVVAYAYLKEKADNDSKHLDLIYSKYADHYFLNYGMKDSIDSLREFHAQILNYTKTYFTQN